MSFPTGLRDALGRLARFEMDDVRARARVLQWPSGKSRTASNRFALIKRERRKEERGERELADKREKERKRIRH